ncbi:berberine bridge enzyme-like Cyn d 4 [Lolium rigidum]|uniref:berberine bridge enzyme-like Cyn d 4 n=1 Tax=Lolium rigidum TaxID=89674 RepID=UPI001F5CAC16|nr:berberine bridge enzyme-like Cyn d 4 [Lolium rigidum]
MAPSTHAAVLLTVCLLSCYMTIPSLAASGEFLQCLSANIPTQLVVTPSSPSFDSVLVSSIRNPMFFTPTTVRPLCIVMPTNASHVQAVVLCGRRHDVRVRVRSGGHDYEGLSYRSERPETFAVVDLSNLRAVRINRRAATAWVDSGATLGELYYTVAKAAPELAFPAGVCPSVGVGGHFSGGGMGMMMRKYGLPVDNVIDATLVDANGRLLDKKAMKRDLFWAIRGGGGNFGIVLSWKVKLVRVPPTVTFFNIRKSVDQGAVNAVAKWQTLAPALPDELSIRVIVGRDALFQSLYLGSCGELERTMSRLFPELGMTRADCREMSWLQSTVYINSGDTKTPLETLLNRTTSLSTFSRNKSDYVKKAITKDLWEKIFPWFNKAGAGIILLEPHGGRVGSIADTATPYPHRSGVLYNIQYVAFWTGNGTDAPNWIKDMYDFMEPFVSKNPRGAYVNYRDLDIGENTVVGGVTSYESGKAWGEKYFGGNFKRLAITKGKVDAGDYFRNEQSVPPLVSRK